MSALYVVVDAATRKRLRQADTQKGVEPVGKDEALVILPGRTVPDERVVAWNPARDDFDPAPAAPTSDDVPLTRRDLQQWRDALASLVDRIDAQLR